jgi:hypothetical protein
MMRELFFGTGAMVIWFVMSAIFLFLATWTWLLVREVGGIRGVALGTLFTCSAITTSGFGLLLSHQTIVSSLVVGAMVTATWWPMLLASIVLCDIYAADRNSHRSFTARSYLWYQRLTRDRNDDGQTTA